MRRTRAAGEKMLAVLGPAVVHTGGGELVAKLIRDGFLNVLFAGNALATHDIEQAFYGTSLGVSLDKGLPDRRGARTPPADDQHDPPASAASRRRSKRGG